jgi:hypothetical protein
MTRSVFVGTNPTDEDNFRVDRNSGRVSTSTTSTLVLIGRGKPSNFPRVYANF